jgi:hypothetical protein
VVRCVRMSASTRRFHPYQTRNRRERGIRGFGGATQFPCTRGELSPSADKTRADLRPWCSTVEVLRRSLIEADGLTPLLSGSVAQAPPGWTRRRRLRGGARPRALDREEGLARGYAASPR